MAYQYSTAHNPPNSPDSKAALAKLIRRTKTSLVLNEHIDEPGDVVFRHARESSGSKASYRSGLARPAAPAVCGTGLQGVVE